MPAWSLLASAIPYAAQAAGQYLTKPKAEEFKPQTGYMKKYMSYLRGRQAGREVYHMAMQPALRAIGAQGRRMQRDIGYQAARSGVAGSGIEAQQRLSAGQMTLQAIQESGEKATAAQMVESRRLGEKAADVTARIGAEEERAQQAFKTAKTQWQRQMISTGVQAVGAVAGAAITQAGQLKSAKSRALQSGMFGDEKAIDDLIRSGDYSAADIDNMVNRTTDIIKSAIAGGATPQEAIAAAKQILPGLNIIGGVPPAGVPPAGDQQLALQKAAEESAAEAARVEAAKEESRLARIAEESAEEARLKSQVAKAKETPFAYDPKFHKPILPRGVELEEEDPSFIAGTLKPLKSSGEAEKRFLLKQEEKKKAEARKKEPVPETKVVPEPVATDEDPHQDFDKEELMRIADATSTTKLEDWNPPKNVEVTLKNSKGKEYTVEWSGFIDGDGKYLLYYGKGKDLRLTKQQFMSAVLRGQAKDVLAER